MNASLCHLPFPGEGPMVVPGGLPAMQFKYPLEVDISPITELMESTFESLEGKIAYLTNTLERVKEVLIGKSTMVENRKEHRCKYWATCSSVRSFACTAHSFACSGLLASLAPSAALTRSLARSLRSLPRSWESE